MTTNEATTTEYMEVRSLELSGGATPPPSDDLDDDDAKDSDTPPGVDELVRAANAYETACRVCNTTEAGEEVFEGVLYDGDMVDLKTAACDVADYLRDHFEFLLGQLEDQTGEEFSELNDAAGSYHAPLLSHAAVVSRGVLYILSNSDCHNSSCACRKVIRLDIRNLRNYPAGASITKVADAE